MALPVLITGAAGNIGEKLAEHLRAAGDVRLTLIDIDPRSDPRIVAADLADPGPWRSLFEGVDVVVHLAAISSAEATWEELARPNFDALVNVFEAARDAGVKRVVFASSVWAMAERRDDLRPIGAGPAMPGGHPYGCSKAFAERMAARYARPGLSVLGVRLGGCRVGDNSPQVLHDPWEDSCWLSNRDMLDGMERAIRAPFEGFHIVTLTSIGLHRRWDLAPARRLLGWRPRSRLRPSFTSRLLGRARRGLVRLIGVAKPARA